jgi:glycosyltransferase involved in cell wall biosynthesis
MRLHKPLLLYDYTRRATDHVTRRLDPTEAWNPARHQIFHAHDLNTLLAAFRLARATSSPLIYDSHELQLATSRATESAPLIRFGLRHYERFLIRRARASITVCDSLARIIAAVHSVRAPTVVRNTPDYVPVQSTRTHVLRDALGIADDLKIALYHGNVTAYRGLEVMLEALPLMPGVAVVFLGTGALRRELEAEAERLDVLGRTAFFHDPVPGDVLNEYIRSANVGVIPLEVHVLNYYFSLPNKLFELTMAGCPIVATDLPEIRAFVSRHGLGRLFAPGSADELAAAVHATLALPAEELEAYRARADEAARQNCWEIERDKLLGVYSALEPGAAATGAAPLRVAA